jgi:hypothetical protein
MGKGVKSLESSAKDLESMIVETVPDEYRSSIVVRAYRKGGSTGLSIEYDDRVEPLVFAVIERPKGAEGPGQ